MIYKKHCNLRAQRTKLCFSLSLTLNKFMHKNIFFEKFSP